MSTCVAMCHDNYTPTTVVTLTTRLQVTKYIRIMHDIHSASIAIGWHPHLLKGQQFIHNNKVAMFQKQGYAYGTHEYQFFVMKNCYELIVLNSFSFKLKRILVITFWYALT